MKKIILSVAAVFAFGFANAQDTTEGAGGKGFANGDVFITGSVGFSTESEGDFKTTSFNIMPQVGFFVTDNIALGGMIGYMGSTSDTFFADAGDFFEVKTNTLAVGAFARYYATPASDFSFFGEFGVAYLTSTSEVDVPGSSELKANGFALALSPGVSYFISDNFALQASIGALQYTTTKPDFEGAESTDNFGLELNLTDIQLGLVYKF